MRTQYRILAAIFALLALLELDAFLTQDKLWCVVAAILFASLAQCLYTESKRKRPSCRG